MRIPSFKGLSVTPSQQGQFIVHQAPRCRVTLPRGALVRGEGDGMPGSWVYREDGEPLEQPALHPPTEIAAQPWRPQEYRQTEHLAQLNRSLPAEPAPRAPQPGFTPQPRRYQPPRNPRAHPQARPADPGWTPPPQPQYRPQPYSSYQPAQMPPRYAPPAQYRPPPRARRKRRVFLWFFLAVQVLFLVWIIAGTASASHGASAAAEAAKYCANGGWQGLFSSQADCDKHYAVALNDAGNIGTGIGIALVVIVWMVTDFFLGLGYGIYRLASRS